MCLILSYSILYVSSSYRNLLYCTSFLFSLHYILFYHLLSHRILSEPIISYFVLSNRILYCNVSYHTLSYMKWKMQFLGYISMFPLYHIISQNLADLR